MTLRIMEFFEYKHLPEHLQAVSAPFRRLAHEMVLAQDDSEELQHGLRKLLEAKDCMVRAALLTHRRVLSEKGVRDAQG